MVLAATSAALFPAMSPAYAAPCVHWHDGDPVNEPHVHPDGTGCDEPGTAISIGGCSFVAATNDVSGQGQMSGEIDVEAVVYSRVDSENPLSAKFTCYILVNGDPQPGAVVTAESVSHDPPVPVVVGGGFITYTSNSVTDFVQLCQTVEYSNGDVTNECFEADTFEIPPPIIWEIVDPPVCDNILKPRAGTYDVGGHTVFINEQGDVYVDGEPQYDCPPYDIVWP